MPLFSMLPHMLRHEPLLLLTMPLFCLRHYAALRSLFLYATGRYFHFFIATPSFLMTPATLSPFSSFRFISPVPQVY
jgi:hypothetical protein